MRGNPTTARGIVFLLSLGLLAGTAAATPQRTPRLVFPVLSSAVTYSDDFGAPRPGGPHQGNDILAPKRALALAVEPGRVKFWTTSASAGCMLYLYGASGTTYLYIHLNNDLTRGNDNRGKCVPGTAYAPGLKDGARVGAGQPVGLVGDSGDANGGHPHLHFEVHPGNRGAVDPYPYLRAAHHLLYAAPAGTLVTLTMSGVVVSASDTTLQVKVEQVFADPLNQRQTSMRRTLVLAVSAATMVQSVSGNGSHAHSVKLTSALPGQPVKILTQPDLATLPTERGDNLALTAGLVLFSPAKKTKP